MFKYLFKLTTIILLSLSFIIISCSKDDKKPTNEEEVRSGVAGYSNPSGYSDYSGYSNSPNYSNSLDYSNSMDFVDSSDSLALSDPETLSDFLDSSDLLTPSDPSDLLVIEKKDGSDFAMSQLKKDVFNKLLNNEPVKSSDITRLLIEEQVSYFNSDEKKASSTTTAENIISDLNNLYSITHKISDITEIKTSYETELYKDGKKMVYNPKATSLPYIFNENRLQCYSSTMLHQLILRVNSNFKNMNSVVIFEDGHVLSGFMSKDGDVWKLTGIENTAKGKALLDYGDITKYDANDIRIVDSELFAVFEIFKNDIANINSVIIQILGITAKKYGLDPKFNYEYDKLSSQYFSSTSLKSNETPLGFGELDTKDEEDKTIEEFDFKDNKTVLEEKRQSYNKVKSLYKVVNTRGSYDAYVREGNVFHTWRWSFDKKKNELKIFYEYEEWLSSNQKLLWNKIDTKTITGFKKISDNNYQIIIGYGEVIDFSVSKDKKTITTVSKDEHIISTETTEGRKIVLEYWE